MTTSSIERCALRTVFLAFAAHLNARAFSTSINVFLAKKFLALVYSIMRAICYHFQPGITWSWCQGFRWQDRRRTKENLVIPLSFPQCSPYE